MEGTRSLETLLRTLLLIVVLFCGLHAQSCDSLTSLGIADPNIIASNRIVTSSEAQGNEKEQIRLNCCEETPGRAWCPDPKDKQPYVEIHLGKATGIGQIDIQAPTIGETNLQHPVNFMKSFDLLIKLPGINELVTVAQNINAIENKSMSLNSISLYPTVFTDVIRIEPRDSENWPCFRLELYQCDTSSMCPLNYCQNDGICSRPYSCDCPDSYYGEMCQYSQETIPLTVLEFLQISGNTIITATHSLTFHGNVVLANNNVLVLPPGSYLDMVDVSQGSCFSDTDKCLSGFTINLVFSMSQIDPNSVIVLSNGGVDNPRVKGITLLFQQGFINCYVSTTKKLWAVIKQFKLTEAAWYKMTISWSLNLGLIVLKDRDLIGSTFIPQLLDTPSTETDILKLGYEEKTSSTVLHLKEITMAPLDWEEFQRADLVRVNEEFVERSWDLRDISQLVIESNGWFLTLRGRPAFGEDGVTLNRIDQDLQISNLGNSCLTNPTLCKHGLTIKIGIKFATIEEDSVVFTTGGEYKNHPGVTLLYRYGQFHAIVSTESFSWFVSVSREIMLTKDFCDIILSWSQHTSLKLIINQVLVGESASPIPHLNITLPYLDKLTIGNGIIESVISEIHIWNTHILRLSDRSLISCIPCIYPTTTPQTTTGRTTSESTTQETTGIRDSTTEGTTEYYDDECPAGCVPSDQCFGDYFTPTPQPTTSCDLSSPPTTVADETTPHTTIVSTAVTKSTTRPSSPPTAATHSTSQATSPTTKESTTTASTAVPTTKPPCPLPTTCPNLPSSPQTTVSSSTNSQPPSTPSTTESSTTQPPLSTSTTERSTTSPPVSTVPQTTLPPTTARDSTTAQTTTQPTVTDSTLAQTSTQPAVTDSTKAQTSTQPTVPDTTTRQPSSASSTTSTTEQQTTPTCTSSSTCPTSATASSSLSPATTTATATDSTTPQTSTQPTVTDSTTAQTSTQPTVTDSTSAQTSTQPAVTDSTTAQTSTQPTVTDSITAQTSTRPTVTDSTTAQTPTQPTVTDSTSAQSSTHPTVTDTTTRQPSSASSTTSTTEQQTTPKCTSSSTCPTSAISSSSLSPATTTATATDSTTPQTSTQPAVTDSTTAQTSTQPTVTDSTTAQTSTQPTVTDSTTPQPTKPTTTTEQPTTPKCTSSSSCPTSASSSSPPETTTATETTTPHTTSLPTTVRDSTTPDTSTVTDSTTPQSTTTTVTDSTTPQPTTTTVIDSTTPQPTTTTVTDSTTPQPTTPTTVTDSTTPQPTTPTTVTDSTTPQPTTPTTVTDSTPQPTTPTTVTDSTTPQQTSPTTVTDSTTPQPTSPTTVTDSTTPQPTTPTTVTDSTTPEPTTPTTVTDSTAPQPSSTSTTEIQTTSKCTSSSTCPTSATSSPSSQSTSVTTPQPTTPTTVTDSTTSQPTTPTTVTDSTTPQPTTPTTVTDSTTPQPTTTTVTDSTTRPITPTTVTDSTTPQPTSPTTVTDSTTPEPTTTVTDSTTPQPTTPTTVTDSTTRPTTPTTVTDSTTPQPTTPTTVTDSTTRPTTPTTVTDSTTPQPTSPTTVTDSTTQPTTTQPSTPTTVTDSTTQPTTTQPTTTPTTTAQPTTTSTTTTTTTTQLPCPQPPSSVTLIPEVNSSGQGHLTCSVAVAPEPGITIRFTWRIEGSTVHWSKEIEAPDRSASISAAEINVSILNKAITCTAEVRYSTPNAEWCWPARSNVVVPSIKCPPVNGTITVVEGREEQFLQIQVTVPPSLLCQPADNGQCRVEVSTTITTVLTDLRCSLKEVIPQAVLGVTTVGQGASLSCGVSITSVNWNNAVTIPVKATADGIKDGDRNRKLKIAVRIIGQVTSVTSVETCGDIDIIVVDRGDGATCSSVNDPHMKSFDNTRYNNFLPGEFVMYKHRTLPYEVRALYAPCNPKKPKGATCNCGAAVRSGDDVITFDSCNTRQNQLIPLGNSFITVGMYKNGELTPGTRVISHCTCSQKYEVILPSGTQVVITGSIKPFLNINIQSSSSDYESTEGLCGSFNNKGSDDLDGYPVKNPDEFNKQWLRNVTIFKGVPAFTTPARPTYCSCQSGQQPFCQPGLDVYRCALGITSGTDITATLVSQAKPPVVFSQVRTLVNQVQSRGRRAVDTTNGQKPTALNDESDFTEETALQYCQEYIENSTAIQHCLNHLRDNAVNESIYNCAEDLLALNDTNWVKSHIEDLIVECLADVQTNVTTWEIKDDADGPNVPEYITNSLCTQNCGEHGVCKNSMCTCDDGWSGDTCQIGLTTTPTVLPATWMCDVLTSSCNNILIEGNNFVPTDKLTCKIKYITIGEKITETSEEYIVPASYISMIQIVCPENTARSSPSRSALVSVSNNGVNYTGNNHIHIVQKSTCQACTLADDVNGVSCAWKPGSCVIDNQCYARFEAYGADACYRCDPDINLNKWTKTSAPNCTDAEAVVGKADSSPDNAVIIGLGVVCGLLALVTIGVAIFIVRSRMRRNTKFQTIWEGEGSSDIFHRRTLASSADVSGQTDAARINAFYNPALPSTSHSDPITISSE